MEHYETAGGGMSVSHKPPFNISDIVNVASKSKWPEIKCM